jgi:DNA mismatch repair protein MutL
MSRIKILPEILSNKIAAGEVVERPASVVKELVENALDADAGRITVAVEKGGRGLIRVADDGIGMGKDDALLAIERYATSKIAKDPDLFCINTLGFRGEALPSIAAVSKFELVTRERGSDTGFQILMDGGKIRKVMEIGAPQGTMISVRRLFFNTPARRKFMKTIATEMGHIADTTARMALGWPQVRIRLSHNDRIIKDWPKATLEERVLAVLGTDLKSQLYPLSINDSHLKAKAWIGSPSRTRSTSRGIHLFVNNRSVRDRMIQHALYRGYTGRLMKGQFPVAVLFLSVPFDQVDVNVHPTKNEIRFAQAKRIHAALKDAVADTLRRLDRPRWESRPSPAKSNDKHRASLAESVGSYGGREELRGGRQQEEEGPKRGSRSQINDVPSETVASRPAGIQADCEPAQSDSIRMDSPPQFASTSPPGSAAAPQFPGPTTQQGLWHPKTFGDLKIVGQIHGTYIVCESRDGLVLIDQHAAHERIAFEELRRVYQGSDKRSQRLLMPESVELGFKEAAILEQMIPDLDRFGLEIEPFGGTTYRINAIPLVLNGREVAPLVLEMVEMVAHIGIQTDMLKVMDRCLILMACHNTIRAHQSLSLAEMKALLDQLDACDNPTRCPTAVRHGFG